MKNEDFSMRGLLDDLDDDEIWGASHTLTSCGKAISIETASLSEYARYVLRTICQQVICKILLLAFLIDHISFWQKSDGCC